jgi:uncharacterized protein YicC (UPF0701 family)
MTGFGRAEGALGPGAGPWRPARQRPQPGGPVPRPARLRRAGARGPRGRAGRFQRGQITVSIQAKRAEGAGAVRINLEQLERYLEAGGPYVAPPAAPPARRSTACCPARRDRGREEDEDPEGRAAVEAAMAATIGQALDGSGRPRAWRRAAADAGILSGLVDRIESLTSKAEPSRRPAGRSPSRSASSARMTELAGEAVTEERIVQEAAAWP